jgi:hypothetical protein
LDRVKKINKQISFGRSAYQLFSKRVFYFIKCG